MLATKEGEVQVIREGLTFKRFFTRDGVHPFDDVEWEQRDAVIPNYREGGNAFEQRDVEFPVTWSQNATNIVAQKYFRGTLGTPERESSVRQLVGRVVDTITGWGREGDYFASDHDAQVFSEELSHLLVNQKASFNSPVWFNLGVPDMTAQASACQPYDSLVSTPAGFVAIGQLVDEDAVGTKVFDADGVTRIVATKANGVKEVLRIQTKSGHTLDVTADHLVWRANGFGTGRFVQAGQLRRGDRMEWHRRDQFGDGISDSVEIVPVEIESIGSRGSMEVYDIQTESGEYLSSGLRVHNCFILAVEDHMSSILNWYVEEGTIFKGGSGSGINLSNLRSSKERVAGGGTASGPVSFMRGADASAGTIKSGGKTRRAAKMVILNADHPDIRDFIWCKANEEHKARALQEAGFDMDLDGKDSYSIQYQNANNSVRVTDEFMKAYQQDQDWRLKAVLSDDTIETVRARALMREIAEAAWECADPGMQYDTTINEWHTCPASGRINASNPCCFVGDTLVDTDEGLVAFEMLEKRAAAGDTLPLARCYDPAAGSPVLRRIQKAWVAGYADRFVELTTALGLSFRCTPEHRFLTDRGYVEARALEPHDRLVATDGPRMFFDEVASRTEVIAAEPTPVYDLEVEELHNFAVTSDGASLSHGVVVHNSEYMHLDNSACNLASLNLMKFVDDEGTFDVKAFRKAVDIVFTAQEIVVGPADYPTEKIGENARAFRQLGLGYANLGALLMARGLPYDSDGGRAWAGSITALMTGQSYRTSARIAEAMGPFEGYEPNADAMLRVMRKHREAADEIDGDLVPEGLLSAAKQSWDDAIAFGIKHGYRNAQATVTAPTGTIGLMMDCDTTGIEPELALVKTKKLVGGGTMQFVNQTVPRALQRLGYDEPQVQDIVAYIAEHNSVDGAPHLREEHSPVFDTAMGAQPIHYMGHVRMMAAAQPFLSGAISKCVTGETLLTTEDGLVRIGDLYDGEQPDTFRDHVATLASLDGIKKTDAFYYGGMRPVREIHLRSGHRVVGTANHQVLVAGKGDLHWRRLDELRPGDYVAVRYGADMWSVLPARFDGFIPTPKYGSQKAVTVPDEMTEELALLLGALVSEGHITRSNWTVTITNADDAVLQRVAAAWVSEFGVQPRIVRQPGKCPGVMVSSKTVVEFLEWLGCGARASAKRIPDAVLRSPRSMVLAFLQGLALDGYVVWMGRSPKWGICVDSPGLLDDLQSVLTNLGVVHSRILKYNRQNGKSYGEVYACGEQAQRMIRLVGFVEGHKRERALAMLELEAGQSTADVVPMIQPPALYEFIPRGKSGRAGYGYRKDFAHLLDPRTRHVSRRTLERVAEIPGVELPAGLQRVLLDDLHFSPVEHVQEAGEREVFDVSVPETQAFVGNGVVNHNTVNMPEHVTVEEVEQLFVESWKLGLKAVAIYRDNCKVAQPMSADKKATATATEPAELATPVRKRLPQSRPSITTKFEVGDAEGYITASSYPDDGLGEIFLKTSKQGSTLAGITDAFSIAISIGLQYGVPLETYVTKFINMKFEPSGMTNDTDIRFASSIVDYVFRRLALDHLTPEQRAGLGINSIEERKRTASAEAAEKAPPPAPADADEVETPGATFRPIEVTARPAAHEADAPLCYACGSKMQPAGSCYVCPSCGSTSGCS
ncbi:MAG: hypothetical protein L0206_08180 [Actinobacteria bacterium]|nr:hypothetical protein [Actinomycetota bacterium]